MTTPFLSVCIPAYNRVQFLEPLLDSILSQDFDDYEIVICEDFSPQREQISVVLQEKYGTNRRIKFFENEKNLGYDANFRELLMRSCGEYCFFMGNDDIMASGALLRVANVLKKNENIGLILRSYDWFVSDFKKPEQTIRYFNGDRIFPPGVKTIATAYRRCGVLSGYVVNREAALGYASDEFDGFLFYQMYLSANILTKMKAYYISDVLTHSRSTEGPDFGNSSKEKSVFTPGEYTSEARIHMVAGMLKIAKSVEGSTGLKFFTAVEKDIANYVYPYIIDQLLLSPKKFFKLYKAMGNLGLKKYKMFHIHFLTAYLLKQKGYNTVTKIIRERLGKSPKIGEIYEGEKIESL